MGTPVALTETLLIIGDAIGKDRVERYLSPAAFFLATEGPQHDDGSRVANGLALALLLHNSRMLHKYMQDLETILQIKPQTFGVNGLKEDGTYIEHMMYLYNAGYGVSIIGQRGLELYSIFKNTGLLPPSIDTAVIDLAIHETFEPILYDGCLLSSFSGRRSIGETDGGEQILAVLLDVVDSFEGVERQRICQMIRRNVLADMLPSLVQRLTVHQASVLSKILAEDGQSVGTAYERAKVYYAGDAVVQQKNGYAAALSMSSERRANYESINGMNLTGWYQSDGALYVYTEGAQFDKDWWTGRNPYHMPGVTADTQQREEKSIYYTEGYLSNQDFVGGVELDKFAVAAMALESFHNETDSGMTDVGYGGSQSVHHSSLTAKKAWFFLDDEIVCLGSDIRAQDGYEVQTTLDNRLLSGNEAVTIGGGLLSADETTANAPGWAHIENFGGYWLPEAEALHVKKTKGTNTFLELWLSHGVNPTAASYCYAVLPKATAAATKAYHANPNVRIIENSGAVQAVCDSEAGLKGIVFWEAAACEGISADAPMTVLIQEQGNTLCIAVSDPTHKLTTSTLRLNGRYTLRSASDRITVGNGADDTELIINFAENCGQTLTAELEIY